MDDDGFFYDDDILSLCEDAVECPACEMEADTVREHFDLFGLL